MTVFAKLRPDSLPPASAGFMLNDAPLRSDRAFTSGLPTMQPVIQQALQRVALTQPSDVAGHLTD